MLNERIGKNLIKNEIVQPKVIIGGVNLGTNNYDYYLKELAELAEADNLEVVGEVVQKLDRKIAGTYFGSGKITEIKTLAEHTAAEYLVVNDELTPTQIRNLEGETGLGVLDRTELILEIFSNRAQTRQAKLQVALARAQYEMPRLHTNATDSLDQQRGGGNANRGAGETKLELNRRTLGKQIAYIKDELKEIEKSSETRRKERNKSHLPQVALVGYTNAGKSTTMNGLLQEFGHGNEQQNNDKQVFEKDMLFATLDTHVRRIDLPHHLSFIFSDTVGFVSNLPHKLIESFKATLQEAKDADLIINVVDVSDPEHAEMLKTTNEVLQELGITETKTIVAYNKADKTALDYPAVAGNDIYYSATDPASIKLLSEVITKNIFADYQEVALVLPLAAGKELAYIQAHGDIIHENYTAEGIELTVRLDPQDLDKFQQYLV